MAWILQLVSPFHSACDTQGENWTNKQRNRWMEANLHNKSEDTAAADSNNTILIIYVPPICLFGFPEILFIQQFFPLRLLSALSSLSRGDHPKRSISAACIDYASLIIRHWLYVACLCTPSQRDSDTVWRRTPTKWTLALKMCWVAEQVLIYVSAGGCAKLPWLLLSLNSITWVFKHFGQKRPELTDRHVTATAGCWVCFCCSANITKHLVFSSTSWYPWKC